MQSDSSSLAPFFAPRGVAVIGASHDPTKLGYGLARNLVQCNYQGAVHFVNPKGGSLFGRPVYPSILEAPDPVDLAILLIPAAFVPATLQECAQRGLKAAIIGSGGFRETGAGRRAARAGVPPHRPGLGHAPDRTQLHRLAGHPPAAGRHFPAAARPAARRCGLHLPFRRDLRGGDRLGARPGLWAFTPGQPGQPGRRQRDRHAGPGRRRPVHPRADPVPGRHQRRAALHRRGQPHHPPETDHRPESRALRQRAAGRRLAHRRAGRAGERLQRRLPPRRGDPRRDQRGDVRLGARPGLVPAARKGGAWRC